MSNKEYEEKLKGLGLDEKDVKKMKTMCDDFQTLDNKICGKCNFLSCRYNFNKCFISEPDRKVCLEVTEMVLGKDYEDFKRWKEEMRDDGK